MDLNIKHKGNTLVEVMVALTLITFCSALGVIIYLNIQQSTRPFMRIKSNELAQKCLAEAINKRDFFDATYTEEEYTLKKNVIRNSLFPDCIDMKVCVYDTEQKKITELQTTIYAE